MPVALIIMLLDITLVYHAAKTGRLQPWAFIILMIPLVGALAYIVVELVPEWFGSPGAQQARRRVANKLDPEKRYRELSDRMLDADTIANRSALAAECLDALPADVCDADGDEAQGEDVLEDDGHSRLTVVRERTAGSE